MELHYRNTLCEKLSPATVAECARLFSENYGVWADDHPDESKRGKAISLSAERLKGMFIGMPGCHAALLYDGERLIGQLFYLRRASPWSGARKVSFVLQLVLDRRYRGHRLGLKLLQSAFGLSNDDAWGLYTSNPLTIRALEDATFRNVSVPMVKKHLPKLKLLLSDVFGDTRWLDSFRNGCVDTKFPVSHVCNEKKIRHAYGDREFPFCERLKTGEEWLAVVFRSQPVNVHAAALRLLTETSWEILRDAYSRMNMVGQGWTAFTRAEVDWLIASGTIKEGDSILDLGCGQGRHSIELARRGFRVHGVDFSVKHIKDARDKARLELGEAQNVSFECADILSMDVKCGYDVVLCLYDVIGSSINDGDDQKISDVVYRALKPNGVAVVSVMNLDLARKSCRKTENRFSDIRAREDFEKLVNLPPSSTMQSSDEIFKGQLMLLNPETGVVYRKEQFVGEEDNLPCEYVIADRRYTADGLRDIFSRFDAVMISHVRAGHWGEPLARDEKHAKEVLGVFRKQSLLERISIWR